MSAKELRARVEAPSPGVAGDTPTGYASGMKSTFSTYALAVVLTVAAIAGLVVLNVTHVDTSPFESLVGVLVVPLLGVLIGKVGAVEKNTNGNTSQLLQIIDDLRRDNARKSDQLARAMPVPPDAPVQVDYQDPPSVGIYPPPAGASAPTPPTYGGTYFGG